MFVRRILCVFLLCAAVAAVPSAVAWADASWLAKNEIVVLLEGNTAIGRHRGVPFRQFFAADGKTSYRGADGKVGQGSWRVTDDGEYCSWRARTGWTCYLVVGNGDRITWHPKDGGAPTAAVIVGGNQLEDGAETDDDMPPITSD